MQAAYIRCRRCGWTPGVCQDGEPHWNLCVSACAGARLRFSVFLLAWARCCPAALAASYWFFHRRWIAFLPLWPAVWGTCVCSSAWAFFTSDSYNGTWLSDTGLLHVEGRVCCTQPSQKTFKIKRVLAKKAKQNRPIPQWIRFRTNNKIRSALPCHSAGLGKRWVSRDWRSVCHTSTANTSPTDVMSVRCGFLPDVRCISLFGLQRACQCELAVCVRPLA